MGGAVLALLAIIGGVVAPRQSPAGPVLSTIGLTEFPTTLFVDAQTRRAFVLTVPLGAGGAHVTTVDLDTGAALRTVTVGSGIAGDTPAALDWRAARLVVAATTITTAPPGVAGRVTVLDARTGAVARVLAVGLYPHSVAADEDAGHTFVAGEGLNGAGLVAMLDTRGGRLLRTSRVGPSPRGDMTVDARARRVFVPVVAQTGPVRVRVVDARSGVVGQTIDVGAFPVAVAATGLGGLLAAGRSGVRLIDLRHGRVPRAIPVGATADGARLAIDAPLRRAVVVTVAGATLLDLDKGTVIGAVPGAQPASTPAFDERTGRLFVLTQPMTGAYVPIGHGGVTMLDARSGKALRTVTVGVDPLAVMVDAARGRVLVLNHGTTPRGGPDLADGSVNVLDARTGAVRATIPVGADPTALAVDDRNGHIVVVTGPTTMLTPDPWGWLPPLARRHLPFVPRAGARLRAVPGSVRVLAATRQ